MALSALSCNEDEIHTYSGPDAANIRINNSDSVEMSFLSFSPTVTEFTYEAALRIQGASKAYDRKIVLSLGDRTTGTAGTNFAVDTEVTIPAGEVSVLLPVVLYKTGLTETEGGYAVELVVTAGTDFIPGVYDRIKIGFSADFPSDWWASTGPVGAIPFMWGRCTKKKYELVYDYLGTIDLKSLAGWNYTPMIAIANALNSLLEQYEQEHGEPMLDYDNSKIWFSGST